MLLSLDIGVTTGAVWEAKAQMGVHKADIFL